MAIVAGFDINYTEECTCRHCASIVRYAKSELQTKIVYNYNLQKAKQDYVICPKCGDHIELFTKQN